ncbi:chorismate-binding protein [Reyranella sp.]|uniref:chorismate-binding protein n=1 Tax=Reyranella sp. TaxID=1929291 RepID=UPI003C7E57F3
MLQPKITQVAPDIDPIAVARARRGSAGGLFQRFDLQTRLLQRSLVTLSADPVAGASLAAALESGLQKKRAGEYVGLLIFSGFEALVGAEAGVAPGTPPFLVLGLRSYLDIDCLAGTACIVGDASPEDLLRPQERRRDLSRVATAATWVQDASQAEHATRVGLIQDAIRNGEAEGAVLSIGLSKATAADPFDIYRACVARNPSPYGYVLNVGNFHLVGSSPLSFARIEGDRVIVETDAGTRPVTGDPNTDAAAEAQLRQSAKDAAEHDVVVQAELDALRTIAAGGQISVPVSREVRRFSHVMHLYTVLEARLGAPGAVAQALMALAPAAAVSGRPKPSAARLGLRVEGAVRGPYGGFVGLIDRHDDADLAVVIRSLWISNGIASLRVGGKVVAGSDAAAEYAEALSKARFLVEAVEQAEGSGS